MVNTLKILDSKKFRTKPIFQKTLIIPDHSIDFIDEDFGISRTLFSSDKLATTTLSDNEGNFIEKFNIIKINDDDKSFMIATKNTDETRLYRDLSVQSNDETSIKKIIRSKLHLRIILMDREDSNDE